MDGTGLGFRHTDRVRLHSPLDFHRGGVRYGLCRVGGLLLPYGFRVVLVVMMEVSMVPVILYKAKQPRQYPSIKRFLADIQMFEWATVRQYRLWFHGKEERDNGRIERLVKALTESGRIQRVWYDGKFVYSCNRINRKRYHHYPHLIFHGLGITEGVIRLWKADPHEKIFLYEHGFSRPRPEFGITYSTGKTILYEFSTADNIREMKKKIKEYELKLNPGQVVLFVADEDREHLRQLILRYQPKGSFYFCDYEKFISVDISDQLTAKIYFNPYGKVEALRDV